MVDREYGGLLGRSYRVERGHLSLESDDQVLKRSKASGDSLAKMPAIKRGNGRTSSPSWPKSTNSDLQHIASHRHRKGHVYHTEVSAACTSTDCTMSSPTVAIETEPTDLRADDSKAGTEVVPM